MKQHMPAIVIGILVILILAFGSIYDSNYGFAYKLDNKSFNSDWKDEWNGLNWAIKDGEGRILNAKTTITIDGNTQYVSIDVWKNGNEYQILWFLKDRYHIRNARPDEVERFERLRKYIIPGGDWYYIERPK